MFVVISVISAICAAVAIGIGVYEIINLFRDRRDSIPVSDEEFPEDEAPPNGWSVNEVNFFDQEEIIPNCTVQILTNSVTGQQSVGWRRNDMWDDFSDTEDDR